MPDLYLQPCMWIDDYCQIHAHRRPLPDPPDRLDQPSVTTELPSGMTWQAPPRGSRTPYWEQVAALLHDNPGEWLKIGELVPIAVANAVRQGKIGALGEGISVRTRDNVRTADGHTLTLYLRWESPAARRRRARKQLPKTLPKETDAPEN